jgi:hypothetical protein
VIVSRAASRQALTLFDAEHRVKSDNSVLRLFDSVENDMTERDAARAAQTKVGKGDWIPRPTKAEVLADVPGARNVQPKLLPEGVQHLASVSARVVARDPNGAVGVTEMGRPFGIK